GADADARGFRACLALAGEVHVDDRDRVSFLARDVALARRHRHELAVGARPDSEWAGLHRNSRRHFDDAAAGERGPEVHDRDILRAGVSRDEIRLAVASLPQRKALRIGPAAEVLWIDVGEEGLAGGNLRRFGRG